MNRPINPLLRSAIIFGVEETVRVRIRQGDDLDARNREGLTPLMLAAKNDRPHILSLLLSAGADPKLVDDSGQNALFHAEQAKSTDCLTLLQTALSTPAPMTPDMTMEPVETSASLNLPAYENTLDEPVPEREPEWPVTDTAPVTVPHPQQDTVAYPAEI
ncbi:MAG: ankyrin repeat domain-containing protein [Methylococcaceae bacterium]